jgi:hypothetical protein
MPSATFIAVPFLESMFRFGATAPGPSTEPPTGILLKSAVMIAGVQVIVPVGVGVGLPVGVGVEVAVFVGVGLAEPVTVGVGV